MTEKVNYLLSISALLIATACDGSPVDIAGQGHALATDADLIVTEIIGPGSAMPDDFIEVAVTACNVGETTSDYAHIDVFLSPDSSITVFDEFIGADSFQYLAPDDCITLPVPGYVWGPEGEYYLGAIVDAYDLTPETDEDNNALTGARFGVGDEADLVIKQVSGPLSAMPGSSFDVSVEACNRGQNPSYGNYVDIVLSSDSVIDLSDEIVSGVATGTLYPGDCQTSIVPSSTNTPGGSFWLGAAIDAGNNESELIEDNNTATGGRVNVGYDPDLQAISVSGPASVTQWSYIDTEVDVCNHGQSTSYGVDVEIYLSDDDAISQTDNWVGSWWLDDLDPGQCESLLVPITPYDVGTFYLGTLVDPFNYTSELDEGNNTAVGGTMTVVPDPGAI